ncbi:MAG: methylated-DNA--[protein]-cysteine S-methyltransferase [Bacteriovoracia bacterium]
MKEQLKSVILPELPIVGHLKLSTKDGKKVYSIEVSKKGKHVELDPFFENCFQELFNFLSGKSKRINIPLDYSSVTPFQMKVLKEMKKIPYGKVATYKDLAEKLNSKGFQAIGTACGRNPFMLICPCHRILGTNNPGGFAHGLKMKSKLLQLEGYSLKLKT